MSKKTTSLLFTILAGAGIGYTVLSLAWRKYLDLQIELDEAKRHGDAAEVARLKQEIEKSRVGAFADRLFGF